MSFSSLAVLRNTASAAAAAAAATRSEPFCFAFGDEDGSDYAEATQLQINPRHYFGLAIVRHTGIGEAYRF